MKLREYFESHDAISQADLARALDVTPSLISQWLSGHRPIAAEQVLPIERATAGVVSRHELRPDIYPRSEVA
jgi:DNA-binding transcriptional regulator YdaS (Cro superfamily)